MALEFKVTLNRLIAWAGFRHIVNTSLRRWKIFRCLLRLHKQGSQCYHVDGVHCFLKTSALTISETCCSTLDIKCQGCSAFSSVAGNESFGNAHFHSEGFFVNNLIPVDLNGP